MIKNKRLYLLGLAFFGAGLLDALSSKDLSDGIAAALDTPGEIVSANSYSADLFGEAINPATAMALSTVLSYVKTPGTATLATSDNKAAINAFTNEKPILTSLNSILATQALLGKADPNIQGPELTYFAYKYRDSNSKIYQVSKVATAAAVNTIAGSISTILEEMATNKQNSIVIESDLSSLPLMITDLDRLLTKNTDGAAANYEIMYSALLGRLMNIAPSLSDSAAPGTAGSPGSDAGGVDTPAALSEEDGTALDIWLKLLKDVQEKVGEKKQAYIADLASTGRLPTLLGRVYTNSSTITQAALAVLNMDWTPVADKQTVTGAIKEDILKQDEALIKSLLRQGRTAQGKPNNARFVLCINRVESKKGTHTLNTFHVAIVPLVGFVDVKISLKEILSQFSLTTDTPPRLTVAPGGAVSSAAPSTLAALGTVSATAPGSSGGPGFIGRMLPGRGRNALPSPAGGSRPASADPRGRSASPASSR